MSKLSKFVIDKLESHSANSKTTLFIALHETFSDRQKNGVSPQLKRLHM